MIYDYDIGVNLFCEQFPHPEKIYLEARQNNIALILTGSSLEENRKVLRFCREHEDVWGTIGIHPHMASQASPEAFWQMSKWLQDPKMVAIGECGLDYNRLFSTKEEQISCLQGHLQLAREINKPLFLHCREAEEDLLKIFDQQASLCERSVVHCFTGNKEHALAFAERGFWFGITGWLCDIKRGEALREAVHILPIERIMVETDCPYLTPKNVPGLSRTNVPQNIFYVLEELARLRGMRVDELRQICRENTLRFFRLFHDN